MKKSLKSIKLNEQPSITICVMGQMKSGKSTLINAILGKSVTETKIQRATLCQSTIRLASNKSKDNTKKIRTMIENMNREMKEQNKLEQVTEFDCKIHSPLFKEIINKIKSPVNIIDTIGYNEDADLGNDEINFKKLKENIPYTDVYIIPTKPDALLQQGDEKKTFRTLLKYIKELKVKPLIFFLVNKKDTFEDEDSIMAECKENVRKELKTSGLVDTVNCRIFPVSARYIGMHRVFLKNKTVEDFDDKKQISLFAKYVLGKRKANKYMTDIHLKQNIETLNKLLIEELNGSDWDTDTGFLELKTKVFDTIYKNEQEMIFKGYQHAIGDNFTNYNPKSNSSILEEILAKIQFTNRYQKSKFWNKIVNEFKTVFIQLTNQLTEMKLESAKTETKLESTKSEAKLESTKSEAKLESTKSEESEIGGESEVGEEDEYKNEELSKFSLKDSKTEENLESTKNEIKNSLGCMKTIFNFLNKKNSWFIANDFWKTLQQIISNIIKIDKYYEKKYSIELLKKNRQHGTSDLIKNNRVCCCLKIHNNEIRTGVITAIRDDQDFQVRFDNNFIGWIDGYQATYAHESDVIEHIFKTDVLNNIESLNNNKYFDIIDTYENETFSKLCEQFYSKISREIRKVYESNNTPTEDLIETLSKKVVKYFPILSNDSKKSMLENIICLKETYLYDVPEYAYFIQKLVYKNHDYMRVLYDHLESVIHLDISRKDRKMIGITIDIDNVSIIKIEKLYCDFIIKNY